MDNEIDQYKTNTRPILFANQDDNLNNIFLWPDLLICPDLSNLCKLNEHYTKMKHLSFSNRKNTDEIPVFELLYLLSRASSQYI